MIRSYRQLDMQELEILNLALERLDVDPALPGEGRVWFSNGTSLPRIRAGGQNRFLVAPDDDFNFTLFVKDTLHVNDTILIYDYENYGYRRIKASVILNQMSTVKDVFKTIHAEYGETNIVADGADDIYFNGDGELLRTTGGIAGTKSIKYELRDQFNMMVLAGPVNGISGKPTFRHLVDGDLPASYNPLLWNSVGDHALIVSGNPHGITMADMGYSIVNNIGDPGSDLNLATEKSIRTALSTKEPALGNPTVDGYVLSSTIAGVRSWIAQESGINIVPTPVANMIPIFQDANTIRGDANFQYIAANDQLNISSQLDSLANSMLTVMQTAAVAATQATVYIYAKSTRAALLVNNVHNGIIAEFEYLNTAYASFTSAGMFINSISELTGDAGVIINNKVYMPTITGTGTATSILYYNRITGQLTYGDAPEGGGATFIDDLSDVDTVTVVPTLNDTLKWNGTNWVPAVYNATFVFTISSFDDGQSSPQLIGSGVWKAAGAITFTATYNNGPPTSANITISSTYGVSWLNPLALTTPFASVASAENTNYPNANGGRTNFVFSATKDGVTPSSFTVYVDFYNYICYGTYVGNSGFTEAIIEALTGKVISNAFTTSRAYVSGTGAYLVLAVPAIYTVIATGQDYETDGGTGFLYNGVACAMKAAEIVSVTNSAGYVENYRVYASYQSNLGSSTLQISTSMQTINKLYYGVTTKTDTFLEADVEALANAPITNDNKQLWNSVTVGPGEYLLFAFPKRLGTVVFWVGGFEGGFGAPETVSITNVNGWTEDYYVWRSTNSNLGATIVETK